MAAGSGESPVTEPLNSRMPLPSDRPTSGRRLGPSTIRAMASTTTSSMGPMFGMGRNLRCWELVRREVRAAAFGTPRPPASCITASRPRPRIRVDRKLAHPANGRRTSHGMLTRRDLLARGAASLATASAASRLVDALAAVAPAGARLQDIEHVVFLVQENRSFDHYFGAYRGVRGFGEPAARAVYRQPGWH